jgi:GNAT superfamily N-acetyltransferase
MNWEFPLEKAIGDIGPGIPAPEFGPSAHDYSHLLTPEHEYAIPNARVIVYKSPSSNKVEASLRDTSGFALAHVASDILPPDPMGRVALAINTADSHTHVPYQVGKGLYWGRMLYEANMAYAKEHLGATHVIGGVHSTFADKAHRGIAEKHGLNYVSLPNVSGYEEYQPSLAEHHGRKFEYQYENEDEHAAVEPSAYDEKFGPYQYTLKSEDYASLSGIPPGKLKRTSGNDGVPYAQYWDYSHLLSPEQHAKGYELELKTVHHGDLDTPPKRWQLFITHPDAPGMIYPHMNPIAGEVNGRFGTYGTDLVFDYARIDKDHRGQHLGRAAYEAVISHFKNNHAATHVRGGLHSSSANITHKAITNKYGLKFVNPPIPVHSNDWESDEPIPPVSAPTYGSFDNAFSGYSYSLGKKEAEFGTPLLKIEEDRTDPLINQMMDTTQYLDEYNLYRKMRSAEWNQNRMAVLLKYRPHIVESYGTDAVYHNPQFTKEVWDHVFKDPQGNLALPDTNAGLANLHRKMLNDQALSEHIPHPAWMTPLEMYKETLAQADWDAAHAAMVPESAADTTADTLIGFAMGSPTRANSGNMTGDTTGTLLEDPLVQKTLPITHKVGASDYRTPLVATLIKTVNAGTQVGNDLRIKLLDYTKDLVSNLERFTSTSTNQYRKINREVAQVLPLVKEMVQGHVPEAYIKKNTTKKGLFTALLTHAPQFPKRKFDKLMEALSSPDAKKFKLKIVEDHISSLLMASPHAEDSHWASMVKAFPSSLKLETIDDPRWTEDLSKFLWTRRPEQTVMDMMAQKGKLTPSLIEHIAAGIGGYDSTVQQQIDAKVAEYQASIDRGENSYNKDVASGKFTTRYYGHPVDLYGLNPYEYSADSAFALARNMRVAGTPEAIVSSTLHGMLDKWEKAFFFIHHAGIAPGTGKRDSSLAYHPWEMAMEYGKNVPADFNKRLADLIVKHSVLGGPSSNDSQREWLDAQGDDIVQEILAKSNKGDVISNLLARTDAKPEWINTVMARPEFNEHPAVGDPRFSQVSQNSWRNNDPLGRDGREDIKQHFRNAVLHSPGLGDAQMAKLIPEVTSGELDMLAGHTGFGRESLNVLIAGQSPIYTNEPELDTNGRQIYDENGDEKYKLGRAGTIKVNERQKMYALMNLYCMQPKLLTEDDWNTLMATGQLENECSNNSGGRSINPLVNHLASDTDVNHPIPQAVVDHMWNGGNAGTKNAMITSSLLSHPQARPEWIDSAIDGNYDLDVWNTLLENKRLSDAQLSRMMTKGTASYKRIISHENFGPEALTATMALPDDDTQKPHAMSKVIADKHDLLTPEIWAKLEESNAFEEKIVNGLRTITNPVLLAAIKVPNVPQTVLDKTWSGTTSPTIKSQLLQHAKARREWIDSAIDSIATTSAAGDNSLVTAVLENPVLSEDQVKRVVQGIEQGSGKFINDDGSPTNLTQFQRNGLPQAWQIFSQSAYGQGDWMMEIGKKMRAYDKARAAAGESKVWDTGHYRTPQFVKDAMKAVELNDPDSFFREEGIPHSRVQVHPGSQILRAVRDLIAKNGAPVHMSQLPPGPDYNRYQMTAPMSDEQWAKVPEKQKQKTNGVRPSKKTGLVSVENMEQAIKDMGDDPLQQYIVTHANYGPGVQSDSNNIPDEVFQLNITTAKANALKAAGVWPLFLRIQKAVHAGGGSHPSRSTGLGWFRHRKVTPEKTMHITEQQSDIRPHGTSWSYFWNQFKGGSARTGNAPQFMHAFTSIFDDTNFPGEKLDLMHNILFGTKTDPATVLIDALHQHLRDNGHHDVTIYTPSSEWRAKLSYNPSSEPGKETDLATLGQRVAPTPEEVAKGRPGKLANNVDIWVPEHNNGGWHKLHDVNPQTGEIKFGIDRTTLKVAPDRKFLARPPSEIPIHMRRVYDDAFKDAGYALRAAPYGEEPTQTGGNYHGRSLKGGIEDLFHTSKVRKYEDMWGRPLRKGISDLPVMPMVDEYRNEQVYDGNEFLTPEHKDAGYGMAVRSGVNQDSVPWIVADVFHHDQAIGGATAYIGDMRRSGDRDITPLTFDIADLNDPMHYGKGLGLAMYEAMISHGRGLYGATHVVSTKPHSTMVHRVHQKLAEKHGLKYQATPNIHPEGRYPTEDAWHAAANEPYDAKYGPYKYTIEPHIDEYDEPNKPLDKMALSNVKVGRLQPMDYPSQDNKEFNYSHLLPLSYRKAGYRIRLSQQGSRSRWDEDPTLKHELHASIEKRVPVAPEHAKYVRERADMLYQKSPQDHAAFIRRHSFITEAIGQAHAYLHHDGALEPHFNSGIEEFHRGQGLGKALYTALFGHAYNVLGARTVRGQLHSVPAGRIHQALAREHGMAYDSDNITTPRKYQDNPHLEGAPEVRTAYNYALKSESPAIH